VGKALAPLRQAGIMLVGTGSTVCNPHRVTGSDAASVESWALAFDEWVSERLATLDVDAPAEFGVARRTRISRRRRPTSSIRCSSCSAPTSPAIA